MKRSEKETLIKVFKLMLENPYNFDRGLCSCVAMLEFDSLITSDEEIITQSYLESKTPYGKSGMYWWPCRLTEPRIKWLKYHIWKLETPWYKRIFNINKP